MFRKTNVEVLDLTPQLAAQIATLPPLKGERELKSSHVEHLIGKIRDGRFASPTWAVAVDKQTGIKYRANGQHSSNALCHLPEDVTFPTDLLATIETYVIDSMDDAHHLFDVFDSPISTRSTADYVTMVKSNFEDLRGISSAFLVQMLNGIDLYEATRPEGRHAPTRYRADVYFHDADNREFIVWAATYSDKLNSHFMSKVGVAAEMFGDFRADREIATEFWNYLMTENHPDPDHETRELARALNDMIDKPRVKTDAYRVRVNRVWKRFFRVALAMKQRELPDSTTGNSVTAEAADVAPAAA